jgi:hypothetical protein
VEAFIDSQDGGLARMAAALRLPERLIPMWGSLPAHSWQLIARPDVIVSSGRPVLVDVNAGSLAGLFPLNDMILRAHQAPELGAAFRGPQRSRFVMGRYADLLRRFLTSDDELIAVAFFAREAAGESHFERWHYECEIHELARLGLAAQMAHVEDLEVTAGGVRLGTRKVGLIHRCFLPDPANPAEMAELARLSAAAGSGKVTVLTGLSGEILSTKATLAILSDERFTAGLPAGVAAGLARAVPWTRILAERHTIWRQGRVDLVPWALRSRARLVLKPVLGHGGHGVVIGREIAEQQWAGAIAAALADHDPWVVQELTVPDHEPVSYLDGAGVLRERRLPVVYGAFVLDGEFVGAIRRYGLRGDGQLMINGVVGAIPAPVYWTDSGRAGRA